MASEDAKKEVPNQEIETDAKKDSAPKITQEVAFLTPDTTLNVLPSTVGGMLVAMSEGTLAGLVAGARANIGINSGRYVFEAKIVDTTSQKHMARFGFCAEGSLFLGEDSNSICFDQTGSSVCDKRKTRCSQAFGADVMVAVVLNRDASSPNKDTISFFKDGVRASKPQPLPDSLKGKTLYPAVAFKNATVHVNFDTPSVALPFKCTPIAKASQKDAVVTKYDEPADGKYTALFPVSLPDQGTFDWVDSFLERNPEYTELSDRAFVDWAAKSGWGNTRRRASNDKPGVDGMENLSGVKKALLQIAELAPRHFVIVEVKGNLIKQDRMAALEQFKHSTVFKTSAEVLVGEPSSSFKKRVQTKMLETKQADSDKVFRAKKGEEKRQWAVRKKVKEAEKIKKKMEKEKKKKAEEAKKAAQKVMKEKVAAQKAALAKAKGTPVEEEEKKEEEAEVAAESEEEPEEPMEPEPADEEPPKVDGLTAEEKAVKFFKSDAPDLTETVFNSNFTKFSLPSSDEGFGTIKYTWNKEKEAAAFVEKFVKDKKQTTRVEEVVPSAEFKKRSNAWQSDLRIWKGAQNDYKAMLAKKVATKSAQAAKKAAKEKKAKENEEKKAKGEAVEEEKDEAEEAEEEEEPHVEFDGIDVFGVEDICDLGGKMPLFKEFQFEDFAMMSLRCELSLLVRCFAQDCPDPDRKSIHLDHLAFYFQKYYGKALSPQSFGVQTMAELVELVDDTVVATDSVLETIVPVALESNGVFVKLAEDARRVRAIRIDMGEESAKLNIRLGAEAGEKRKWNNDGNEGQNKQWKTGGWGGGAADWGSAGGGGWGGGGGKGRW